MAQPLLPSTFLFRFTVPCRRCEKLWTPQGVGLDESHAIPNFGELDGFPSFAALRIGWNVGGLAFALRVTGKQQTPWCRAGRIEDSDGLHLWIDTRDTHNIHRASRFCHEFVFLPSGDGRGDREPLARLALINRARENPKPVAAASLSAFSQVLSDGYMLQGCIPAAAITGYDPAEHPRLGFYYAVVDRELGWQTLSLAPEFPFAEDPSLWGTLELVDAKER